MRREDRGAQRKECALPSSPSKARAAVSLSLPHLFDVHGGMRSPWRRKTPRLSLLILSATSSICPSGHLQNVIICKSICSMCSSSKPACSKRTNLSSTGGGGLSLLTLICAFPCPLATSSPLTSTHDCLHVLSAAVGLGNSSSHPLYVRRAYPYAYFRPPSFTTTYVI